jgi:hypothetical protein
MSWIRITDCYYYHYYYLLFILIFQDPEETGLQDLQTADTRTYGYNLARQLVTPHILRRVTRAGIQNFVKTKARCYLGK